MGQIARGLLHHVVKLRHVRVGGVGREVRPHAVHVDSVLAQVRDHIAQVAERDAQVRIPLPAPRVRGLEAASAHHLHRKPKPHGRRRKGELRETFERLALRHGPHQHALQIGFGELLFRRGLCLRLLGLLLDRLLCCRL